MPGKHPGYIARSILTILPSLSPATAFLALQQRLAAPLAVAPHKRIFAWLVRRSCGCAIILFALARIVKRDGEGDTCATRGGGDAEGLQRRHRPGFDVDGGGGAGLLCRGRNGGVDCHYEAMPRAIATLGGETESRCLAMRTWRSRQNAIHPVLPVIAIRYMSGPPMPVGPINIAGRGSWPKFAPATQATYYVCHLLSYVPRMGISLPIHTLYRYIYIARI
jgi:hypothetical protein